MHTMSLLIVVPAKNEAKILPLAIPFLFNSLNNYFKDVEWGVVVADNGSTDNTEDVVQNICLKYSQLSYVKILQSGRGNALRLLWSNSNADYFAYIDADMGINPKSLHEAYLSMSDNTNDIIVGSRFHQGSSAQIPWYRKVMTWGSTRLVYRLFKYPLGDTQCGMKMISAKAFFQLEPYLHETGWFFDTEIILQAYHKGFRISTVAVEVIHQRLMSRVSRVSIVKDSFNFLVFLFKLKGRLA